jgi:hypothetical protein
MPENDAERRDRQTETREDCSSESTQRALPLYRTIRMLMKLPECV